MIVAIISVVALVCIVVLIYAVVTAKDIPNEMTEEEKATCREIIRANNEFDS